MLVTDQAKLIRMSVGDTRVIGRGSAGVRLFDVAPGEHVVSAARIDEEEEPQNEAEALVTEEVAHSTSSDPEGVQLDDGTGPHTLDERVDEEDDEEG
jgi:DNA gyrase subunit A